MDGGFRGTPIDANPVAGLRGCPASALEAPPWPVKDDEI